MTQVLTQSDASLPHLTGLNAPQLEAVRTIEGPLLILAGAGTGKTRVLISRITEILATGKAWPSQILAVTFTNKAATEMRERTEALLGQPTQGFWIGTFHGTCAKILRQYAELVGLSTQFTIINGDDQIRTIRQLLKEEELDDRKENAKVILGIIEGWKDRAIFSHKLSSSDCTHKHAGVARRLYSLYEARLKQLNAVDFSNLLLHTIQIFTEHSDILKRFQEQFHYVLVDEYQDTNIAQYLWLRLLSQSRKNICCVGDDDQSIYGWRGAEVGNILRFEHDFPGAKVIKLEQNYRSTSHILGAASGLINHNENRHSKTLWTDQSDGEKVMVKNTWDNREEARWAAEEAESLQYAGQRLSDMAILVRTGFQTREFEECFMTMGIPYKIIGSMRFYERQEIRDAVAYLRLLTNQHDGLAFERIANVPRRGVGPSCMNLIHEFARDQQISLVASTEKLLETSEIKGKAKQNLQRFIDDLKRWRSLKDTTSPAQLARDILEETGYIAMWKQDKTPDSQGRIENIKELISAIDQYETLEDFIDHVSLVMENTSQKNDDVITVMTMHAAKGLEFEYVFLCGWEEGLFPAQRSYDEGSLEEERRLAYVALTRAKKRAYVSFATNRHYFGQWQNNPPSRFIDEIPKDHITWLPGAFQRQRSASVETMPIATHQQQPQNKNDFYLGERVFHQKFGYGTIKSADKEAAFVNFDHTGPKRVIHRFLERL